MQLGNKKMTKAIDETQVYLFCEYTNNDQLWNKNDHLKMHLIFYH